MPDRDVRLVAVSEPQPLTLLVETFLGSTSRPKTVRYHFPADMRGVVLFSHGTGGSNTFIEGTEPFALAVALVRAGYGVMGTEAEEAVAGDLNGDGKERWFASAAVFRADNVDLRNLEMLFASFETRGLVPAGLPKFALGMSAGGSFSHFLGTVGASAAAGDFPRLRFAAVAQLLRGRHGGTLRAHVDHAIGLVHVRQRRQSRGLEQRGAHELSHARQSRHRDGLRRAPTITLVRRALQPHRRNFARDLPRDGG